MSEAKNAEAELAKVLQEALSTWMTRGNAMIAARALRSAGYAKREDVLEEAAKVADIESASISSQVPWFEELGNYDTIGNLESASVTAQAIAASIRSLKGQP